MFKLLRFLLWTIIVFCIGFLCCYFDWIPQITEVLDKLFKN